ncbi:hypothetical protein M8542_33645 [Amycolatopsis sp. OK19-0408]|uniref:Uncharacterized protein n=1 Tax=Amycolatopsis iheyensis TaxID=2945988 RepID=A0A9X2SP40_9PSEU|nr:hypothetical protein [Amycolatopsis iheyensis]MCR6487781.1 hypothetical protein [Amycolatopsis iheyensis]
MTSDLLRNRPEERSPAAPPPVSARARVGWLLRVNRTLGPRSRHRSLAGFAREFAPDQRIAPSTLSRWETGKVAIPHWAPARYEATLALPAMLLSAAADTSYRYHTPPSALIPNWAQHRRRPGPGPLLDELVDRAAGDDVMSAGSWDRLSELIARRPQLVLSPASTWARLTERLLTELSIADGVQWMVRAESYHRLIAHPHGQGPAIATATAAADDSSAQSMIGHLSVFTASSHPAASTSVIRHVIDPATVRTFYGALLTSVKKLRYGHFSRAQVRSLLPVLVELLTGTQEEAGLAARLFAALPGDLRAQLPRRVHPAAGLVADEPISRLCDSVLSTAAGDDPLPPDPVLPVLVHEMLTDPVFDVRLCAMFLLYASPYRPHLARALATELVTLLRRRTDRLRTLRILESLRVLGGPSQRALVEQLVLARDMPAEIHDMAAYTLGHIGGRSTVTFHRTAFSRYSSHWARTSSARDASVLDRLVYASGIHHNDALLRRAAANQTLPRNVRTAAAWWLGLPPHLRHSATL